MIACTDGAIECRDASDNELGIEGLRRVLESDANRTIAQTLDAMMSHIARFRSGQPEDDTLVLAVKLGEEPR